VTDESRRNVCRERERERETIENNREGKRDGEMNVVLAGKVRTVKG